MQTTIERRPRVTVSGSFNRHWDAVKRAIEHFGKAQCDVLSPQSTERGNTVDHFVYLKGESGRPEDIERRHLKAISGSDALYVASPDGYVGLSVALEIGYGLALGVPVWSSERLREIPHRDLVQVGSVDQVVADLQKRGRLEGDISSDSLKGLQRYYERAALKRGFNEETPEQVLMLLMEEVGELAKALRARVGVSVQENDTSTKSVRLELADCFIYLLHMANQTHNDLYAAFCEKERLNVDKRWVHPHHDERPEK